jgi:hypothetical protein
VERRDWIAGVVVVRGDGDAVTKAKPSPRRSTPR